MKHLRLFEEHSTYDSGIKSHQAEELAQKIEEYQDLIVALIEQPDGQVKMSNCESECLKKLARYDKITRDFVLDSLFYGNVFDDLEEEIIELGDKIMSRYGTEPMMVVHAFEDCFSILERNGLSLEGEE